MSSSQKVSKGVYIIKALFGRSLVRFIQEPDFGLSLYDERRAAFPCNIIFIYFLCFLSYLEELQYFWLFFSYLNIFLFEKLPQCQFIAIDFSFRMELHSAGFIQELIIIISTCLIFLQTIQIHPCRLFSKIIFYLDIVFLS